MNTARKACETAFPWLCPLTGKVVDEQFRKSTAMSSLYQE